MEFYEYNQNNSGGSFDVDKKLCHRLIIEARDTSAANDKAEELGVYFNGCSSGMDCPCCGDRWSTPWEALEFPKTYGGMTKDAAEAAAKKYGVEVRPLKGSRFMNYTHEVVFETVEQYAQYMADEYGWTDPDVRIYYADGSMVEIRSAKAEK